MRVDRCEDEVCRDRAADKAAKREGLRSKRKRLVERGWARKKLLENSRSTGLPFPEVAVSHTG